MIGAEEDFAKTGLELAFEITPASALGGGGPTGDVFASAGEGGAALAGAGACTGERVLELPLVREGLP